MTATTQDRITRLLSRLSARPAFAYGAILAVQAKILWGSLRYRDITYGDTAHYFREANRWASSLKGNMVTSPLYTAVYGALFRLTHDAYVATIVHRVVIALAATTLVLAVLRVLLPPAIAWLVAAWWAVLPSCFDTLYEVHLFALLPVLVAALLVARHPSRTRRAGALAILVGTAALVRNEYVLAVVLFGAGCLWHETGVVRRGEVGSLTVVRTYGVAALAVLLVIGAFYARSTVQLPQLGDELRAKQAWTLCQHYAFGYGQQHPEWMHNPWTECQGLMEHDFGTPLPSLLDMETSNPGALVRYLGWNVHLVPAGLQLALFDQVSGRDNPDVVPMSTSRTPPLVLSWMLLGVVLAALALGWRARAAWPGYARPRSWLALLLGATSAVAAGVMLTTRPQPAYMFPLTLSTMVAAALCVTLIFRRMGALDGLAPAVPVIAVLLIVFIPPAGHSGARPLHDAYYRLRPYVAELRRPDAVLIATRLSFELCAYLGSPSPACSASSWTDVQRAATEARSFGAALDRSRATVIYADDNLLVEPSARSFLRRPSDAGWRVVASGGGGGHPWEVLLRNGTPPGTHGRSSTTS